MNGPTAALVGVAAVVAWDRFWSKLGFDPADTFMCILALLVVGTISYYFFALIGYVIMAPFH